MIRYDQLGIRGKDIELTCLYQNVRGLRTKTDQIFLSTLVANEDIIAPTETWLHNGIQNGDMESFLISNIWCFVRTDKRVLVLRGGEVVF